MSDIRHGWKEALAPTAECIDIAQFDDLDRDAIMHLDSCARCQAELALYREYQRDEVSADDAAAAQWIAGELKRRTQQSDNVKPFRARSFRVLYAAAAAIVLVIGAGFWMQLREPAIDGAIDGPAIYRSARLEVVSPVGDLAQAPNELRWTAVAQASRYHVQISEVDATLVWSGDATQPRIALPSAVIAQFAPGKTLQWEVKALRGNETLATSGTQTVRVSVAPLRKEP